MVLPTWVKQFVEKIEEDKGDFVPGHKIKIGKRYILCSDQGEWSGEVEITDGQFWGLHGVSNFWSWRRVLKSGKLSKKEYHGYGGFKERN